MLEMHEGEAPSEPMKPLTELVKEVEHHNATIHDSKGIYSTHLSEVCGRCKLQAWLREADAEIAFKYLGQFKEEHVPGFAIQAARWFRMELLGTTQSGGEQQ